MAGFVRFALVVCCLVSAFLFWQSFIDEGGGISRSEAQPVFMLAALVTVGVGVVSATLNAKEKKQKLAAQQAAYAAYQAQAHAHAQWHAQQHAQQGSWTGPRG